MVASTIWADERDDKYDEPVPKRHGKKVRSLIRLPEKVLNGPVGSNLQALFLCSGIYSKMIFTDRVVK
jgi:hypothetical protein